MAIFQTQHSETALLELQLHLEHVMKKYINFIGLSQTFSRLCHMRNRPLVLVNIELNIGPDTKPILVHL